ncbi:hypothetical protein OKW43_002830 [Paraburkholderia sp. WC7.3g]
MTRVELQQVLLNLVINAIEDMGGISDGVREVLVSTSEADAGCVLGRYAIRGRALPRTAPSAFSPRSTRRSRPAWGWGCRSAARSLKHTADDYGRAPTCRAALSFSSRCRFIQSFHRDCTQREHFFGVAVCASAQADDGTCDQPASVRCLALRRHWNDRRSAHTSGRSWPGAALRAVGRTRPVPAPQLVSANVTIALQSGRTTPRCRSDMA